MQLPNNKQAALKIIEQYNDAIKTCLEQNNVSALQETYDIRSNLIKEFFEKFSSRINEDDRIFFEGVKAIDAGAVKAMKEVKKKTLSEISSQKKTRKGINSYHEIAKKE